MLYRSWVGLKIEVNVLPIGCDVQVNQYSTSRPSIYASKNMPAISSFCWPMHRRAKTCLKKIQSKLCRHDLFQVCMCTNFAQVSSTFRSLWLDVCHFTNILCVLHTVYDRNNCFRFCLFLFFFGLFFFCLSLDKLCIYP